jgi:hypothetical protein
VGESMKFPTLAYALCGADTPFDFAQGGLSADFEFVLRFLALGFFFK